MKKVTVKDIEKFSSLTDIPLIYLHKLMELDVLHEPNALARLMKADYKDVQKLKIDSARYLVQLDQYFPHSFTKISS